MTPPRHCPSPGHPLRGFELEDGPYRPLPTPLPIPVGPAESGDTLVAQPTYSVENVANSYHHNQDYDAHYNAPGQDYVLHPEEHHDAYYQPPYEPSAPDDRSLSEYPSNERQDYFEDDDQHPILEQSNPYGPNPRLDPESYNDTPNVPSPVPIRRWKTVKEVQLVNGNLVLDCPVPPKLLNQFPHAETLDRNEFTHMRYSAATCDPSEFFEQRFTLRQRLFSKARVLAHAW